MYKLNLNIDKYPLTVERLREMQDTTQHVSNALAGIRDRYGRKKSFILSGCERAGDAGYVIHNDEMYNVVKSSSVGVAYLKIETKQIKDVIDGVSTVISTETYMTWSTTDNGAAIAYADLARLKVDLAKADTEPVKLFGIGAIGSLVMLDKFSAYISNGDVVISGEYDATFDSNGYSLQLPSQFIPTVDRIIPIRINDSYGTAIVTSDAGVIKIAGEIKKGDIIRINTVIEGRYII